MSFLKGVSQDLIDDEQLIEEIYEMDKDVDIYNMLRDQDISNETIVETIEDYYVVEHLKVDDLKIKKMNVDLKKELREENVIILEDENGKEVVALSDPLNSQKIARIRNNFKLPADTEFKFAFDFEIDNKYFQDSQDNANEEVIKLNENIVISDWVDDVLNKGIDFNASDIHVEPTENGLQTRYRVDGDLVFKKVYETSDDLKNKIVSRMKVMSRMDLSEKRKPQDGKITNYNYKDELYEIRVSTVALVLGEKIVFRIAKKSMDFVDFKDLGFYDTAIEDTKRFLKRKNGIIFLGGATGSGKTTTLYAMINYLNNDSTNIYTIEDPVEKKMVNINQIEIHEKGGITYPNTLRALLRQDPDVIVVGEVRDLETAELAANGSVTGHLMLSTVHANDAIGTVTRLLDMGLEPFLLGSTAIAFYSQRLLKKLCNNCKEPKTEFTEEEKLWLKRVENKYNISYDITKPIYQECGCSQCIEGNIGRTALVEYIEVDNEVRDVILRNGNEEEILNKGLEQGFKPFIHTGLDKLSKGEISIKTLMEAEIV